MVGLEVTEAAAAEEGEVEEKEKLGVVALGSEIGVKLGSVMLGKDIGVKLGIEIGVKLGSVMLGIEIGVYEKVGTE